VRAGVDVSALRRSPSASRRYRCSQLPRVNRAGGLERFGGGGGEGSAVGATAAFHSLVAFVMTLVALLVFALAIGLSPRVSIVQIDRPRIVACARALSHESERGRSPASPLYYTPIARADEAAARKRPVN
jgi:hypothetical protein